MTDEFKPKRSRPRVLYLEEYRCGCNDVNYRSKLLGYCGTHGESRKRITVLGREDNPILKDIPRGLHK